MKVFAPRLGLKLSEYLRFARRLSADNGRGGLGPSSHPDTVSSGLRDLSAAALVGLDLPRDVWCRCGAAGRSLGEPNRHRLAAYRMMSLGVV